MCSSSADSYLLQIQEYVAPSATAAPSKPAEETKPANGMTGEGATPTPAPSVATPPETVLKWYDVEIVKGTQFTVTAYNVATEEMEPNVMSNTITCTCTGVIR